MCIRDRRRLNAHIFHDRFLATLLINFGSLLFFGSTYTILLALFAKTELRTTPAGLGVLYTAIGIGTIVGSLACLLYTSDAADDLTRVELGGARMITKKK